MKDDRRSAEVVLSASRLVRLLEEETALLLAMQPQEIDTLQERKAALVKDYEEKLEALTRARNQAALEGSEQGPAEAPAISSAARQELRLASAALQAAAEDNERALTAAKLATDQLVHSIAAAVLEEQRVQEQYGANGQAGQESKAGAPPAVSINQLL